MIKAGENSDRNSHDQTDYPEHCEAMREERREILVVCDTKFVEHDNVACESDEEREVETISGSKVEPGSKQQFPKIQLSRSRTGPISPNPYMNMWLESTIVGPMQKRILLLPLVWGAFGISEVLVVNYLLGSVVNSLPYPTNDKPIGGSYIPVLAFNVLGILVVMGLSLYSLGIWNIDWTNRKTRAEFVALGVLFGSLIAVFYYPIFLFSAAVSLVYFLASNID